MTQKDTVLAHLQEHGTITSLQAMHLHGIIQLPRRIFDLRKEGYPIESRFLTVRNRYEKPVTIAQYKLRSAE
jgi:hypothetical protein